MLTKIVSWNVAGFRACLKKGFDDFFNNIDADIFCLQEVKALAEEINFNPSNYISFLNPANKKGYSGTMIYTKKKPLSVKYGIDIFEHDQEGRVITLEYSDFYLVNVYVPNVKRDLSRLTYRMQWEEDFLQYINNLKRQKSVIICGDFNVAHTEMDIKNAKANIGNAGFTDEERQKFSALLSNHLTDSYRHFHPNEKDKYTWWSYRPHVREKNIGWRIDYFLVSDDILPQIKETEIYDQIQGSDHCPISITLENISIEV